MRVWLVAGCTLAGAAWAQGQPCSECHPAEHAEWAPSRHAHAFTNANFTASYRAGPSRWCLGCHQPEGRAEAGVGCVSCHPAPHTQTPVRCDGCHQFDLPTRATRHLARPRSAGVALQDTAVEHRNSGEGGCAGCHLARGGHAFPGAYDVEWLRASVRHTACIASDGSVDVQLTSSGVGHHLPTGDPFRRLIARVCTDARCSLAVSHVQLERALSHQSPPRVGYDTALRPGATARHLLPIARGYALPPTAHLELSYRYADPALEPRLEPAETAAVLAVTPLSPCREGAPP